MRWRPTYLWLTGLLVFGPSLLFWALHTWLAVFRLGGTWSFDPLAFRHTYLPMLAAVIGFAVPLFGLRLCWNARWKRTLTALACYWLIMLGWGVIDIRQYNYQIGGHYHGSSAEGHPGYFHQYFTWYFLPYYSIEP